MIVKHINLFVIKEIFKESKIKLKPTTRMYYIEFLYLNFQDKEPFITNLSEFDVSGSLAKTCEKELEELVEGGLVAKIDEGHYKFINFWSKHMELSLLQNDVYLPDTPSLEKIKAQIAESAQLFDVIKMRHKLSHSQILNLLDLFIMEQGALDNVYFKLQDARRHFMNWVNYNKDRTKEKGVTSNSKILGL